jgi:cytochrome P450
MNIFEAASRKKLRFDFNGQISVEQLWSATMPSLTDYEQQLTEVVEGYGKATRRSRKAKTVAQEQNELRLDIVTHILDVREAEQVEAETAQANKAHNQKILELIQGKKENELQGKSIEELEAMLK